ncbi:MAG: DoxX family protein [Gammaproteobacteria bacterium]|nr:DoxX family protein [Gammaproteobacteria bacterium]
MQRAQLIGLGIVFVWFMGGGIGHFVATAFFVNIVPPYVPYPLEMVYLTGVFEILGALGLLLPATRRLAGLGLFLLTLAVTPANVHMWLNPALFPEIPPALLSVRLVIQVMLLGCIWWSTRPAMQQAGLARA